MIEPRTFHASGIAGQACSHRYLEDTHAEVMQKLFFFYFSLILSKDHWLVLQCIAGAAQRRVGRIEVG